MFPIFSRRFINTIVGISIVLGLNLGLAPEVKAQFLQEYEDGIVEIIKCNDRTGFDLGIIEVISSLIRLVIFFLGFLMLSAVVFNKSAAVIKIIIYVILAFSGANMLYELGIKPHMNLARDLSVFAASFEKNRNFSLNIDPIGLGDFGDGTDIANPPIGNGGLTLLPPPPPLQGISQGELGGGSEQVPGSGSYICNPNN